MYLHGNGGAWDFSGTTGSLMGKWPGSAHGSFGGGYRVLMGQGNALDNLGLQYDLYSPIANPLSSVGFKVGWTFLFGGTPGAGPGKGGPTPKPPPPP